MDYNIGDKVFNDWTITRVIGEGSYGRVMEVEKSEFGLNVKSALKVITIPQNQSEVKQIASEGLDNKSVTSYFYGFVEEIIKEIATMSELKGQTNIVSYEDHSVIPHENQIGWDILIRMELLTPLNEYIASNEITERTVVSLGQDIATALELCQHKNIIHRDIKPENIFISPDGNFKLGDFGIAKTVDKTTTVMSQKGTYNYMAPEVYMGKQSDYMVDMYSLGLVMYRLLNYNRMPFLPDYPAPVTYQNREEALHKRIGNEKIPVPKSGGDALKSIVLKMIAFEPSERYGSIADFRKELDEVQADENTVINIVKSKKTQIQEEKDDKTTYIFSKSVRVNQEAQTEEAFEEEDDRWNRTTFLFGTPLTPKVQGSHSDELRDKAVEKDEHGEVEELLSELEKKPKQQKQINLKVFLVIGIGIVAIILIAITVLINRKTEVPDFIGMTLQEAQESADANRVALLSTQEYSNTIEEGRIISQDVMKGTEVRVKEKVQVVVSKGAELVEVPDFVGMTIDEAKEAAERAGVELDITEENSESVDAGVVISQKEDGGTSVEKGSEIKIVVSIGKVIIRVPEFIGMTVNEAIIRCSEIGLSVTTLQEYSDTIEENLIMEQSLESGMEVEEGTQIFFIVSMGKDSSQNIGSNSISSSGNDGSANSVMPSADSGPAEVDVPAESEPVTESTKEGFTMGEVEWGE